MTELLPFDLTLWQTGEYDVCTADGRAVHLEAALIPPPYRLRGMLNVERIDRGWTESGHYYGQDASCTLDLRLVRKTTCAACGQKLPEKKWDECRLIPPERFEPYNLAWQTWYNEVPKHRPFMHARVSDAGDIEVMIGEKWVAVGGGG